MVPRKAFTKLKSNPVLEKLFSFGKYSLIVFGLLAYYLKTATHINAPSLRNVFETNGRTHVITIIKKRCGSFPHTGRGFGRVGSMRRARGQNVCFSSDLKMNALSPIVST